MGCVAFPAQLRLRCAGEAARPLGPWTKPCQALVMPLETQHAMRQLVEHCAMHRRSSGSDLLVTNGTCLTAWATSLQGDTAHHLEPLAARRLDRTFAVEPIELVAERQPTASSDTVMDEAATTNHQPLRYGEGFRLRAKSCASLYLGHAGAAGGGLCWVYSPGEAKGAVVERETTLAQTAPRNSRFAAHGGELGAPLPFGRPLSLLRVASPEPKTDTESESDSSNGSGSESSSERRLRGSALRRSTKARMRRAMSLDASPPQDLLAQATSSLANQLQKESYFAQLADNEGAFSTTFLPLLT